MTKRELIDYLESLSIHDDVVINTCQINFRSNSNTIVTIHNSLRDEIAIMERWKTDMGLVRASAVTNEVSTSNLE